MKDLNWYLQHVEMAYEACKRYYDYPNHGEMIMGDYEYDMLYRDLERFEEENPEHIHPKSPVGKVEGGIHDKT